MHAKENGGVMGKRMIWLPLEQIIPDTMHEKWVNLLETKCGVTLPVEDEKRCTFVKRWEEARVSRSQALAILKHHKRFLRLFTQAQPTNTRHQTIAQVWDDFYALTQHW
jgi:hypothetical protein